MAVLQNCHKTQSENDKVLLYSSKMIAQLINANSELITSFKSPEILPKLLVSGKTDSVLAAVRIIGNIFCLSTLEIEVLLGFLWAFHQFFKLGMPQIRVSECSQPAPFVRFPCDPH